MATTSSAPANSHGGNIAMEPNESVAQMLQENMRELVKLALEGKISDAHVQQLREITSLAAGSTKQRTVPDASTGEEAMAGALNEPDAPASSATSDEDEDEESDDDLSLPDPIVTEDALRCVECAWEIVDCFCQGCGLEHNEYDGEDPAYPDTYATTATYDDILHTDRQALPRGSTPVTEIDPDSVTVPAEYAQRKEMYCDLLSRGATPLMCVRYNLRFYHGLGIIAWADDDLFEMFTGDLMEVGDLWQICLGRRVDLDLGDPDGYDFVRDLVEESSLFPITFTPEHGAWETVLTRQGRKKKRVWVTRPAMVALDVLSDSDNGESEEDGDNMNAGEAAVTVDELDIDPYAPPATLFIDEYEEETDSEVDDADADFHHSVSESGEASEMVLRDAAWDSDTFFQGYSSSEDSEIGLENGDSNEEW